MCRDTLAILFVIVMCMAMGFFLGVKYQQQLTASVEQNTADSSQSIPWCQSGEKE